MKKQLAKFIVFAFLALIIFLLFFYFITSKISFLEQEKALCYYVNPLSELKSDLCTNLFKIPIFIYIIVGLYVLILLFLVSYFYDLMKFYYSDLLPQDLNTPIPSPLAEVKQ